MIVVAKFDRLFRSVADAARTIVEFDRMGIDLVAIAECFDMTNPHGGAMAQMACVFVEFLAVTTGSFVMKSSTQQHTLTVSLGICQALHIGSREISTIPGA